MILSTLPQKLQVGDYKITQHFAWWPTEVEGYVIWFEKFKKIYEWRVRDRYNCFRGICYTFKNCGGWDLIATQRINK